MCQRDPHVTIRHGNNSRWSNLIVSKAINAPDLLLLLCNGSQYIAHPQAHPFTSSQLHLWIRLLCSSRVCLWVTTWGTGFPLPLVAWYWQVMC